MQSLDRSMLLEARPELDGAFARTRDIDHFCSSSAWTFAADRALVAPRELYCRRGSRGWSVLARRLHDQGWTSLEALECAWCLASPFAWTGDDADALAFSDELARDWEANAPRDVLFLSGLVQGAALFGGLVRALAPSYELTVDSVPPTRRFRASLSGGLDGFLGRRSPGFREGLRHAARKATRAGVSFEAAPVASEADAASLYERLLAIEARSWKGLSGEGLVIPSMQSFYREMLPILARDGAVRAQIGRIGGDDVAVIVGAVSPTPDGLVYRGLQFSFDDAHRSLSLGNLAQLAQLRALCDEGVTVYDLGSEVDYKRRWGESCFETVTLVAIPDALRGR